MSCRGARARRVHEDVGAGRPLTAFEIEEQDSPVQIDDTPTDR
jgi:hypothetical protein